MNIGSIRSRYADGGDVSEMPSTVSTSKSKSSPEEIASNPSVYIKIDINNNGEVSAKTEEDKSKQKNSPFGEDFGQKLSRQVRDIVKDEMVQQSRVGGINSQIRRTK